MLCPEGTLNQTEDIRKLEKDICPKKSKKIHTEGNASLELGSFKNPKTWKKSISNFFRNQTRSTRSNDGDRPSCSSKEHFEDKEISREQKWQSLGKVFRRQSFAEHWQKSSNHDGEPSSHSKRLAIKKALSTYFTKTSKSSCVTNEK